MPRHALTCLTLAGALASPLGCERPGRRYTSPPTQEWEHARATVAELERPEVYECVILDGRLEELSRSDARGRVDYLRAELALACGERERWRELHELSATRERYRPSGARLIDGAVIARDWDAALRHLELASGMTSHPRHQQLLRGLHEDLVRARWIDLGRRQDFDALERATKKALVLDPGELEIWARLLRLYVQQAMRDPDKRWRVLAQVTERDALELVERLGVPHPGLELAMGMLRELEGDRARARQSWERAARINVALVEPRLWIAHAALDSRDFYRARVELQRYVEVFPGRLDARVALGVALRGTGDEESARRIYAELEREWQAAEDLLLDLPHLESDPGLADLLELTHERAAEVARLGELELIFGPSSS